MRESRGRTKLVMTVLLSSVLVAAGLYALLFDHKASTDLQKAAAGWIGLVVGYWFQ